MIKENHRAVLIVVPDWPGGTGGMKLGSALQSALKTTKDKMTLVQMSLERIFSYKTDVGEAEFRETMKSRGFGSNQVIRLLRFLKPDHDYLRKVLVSARTH
jgi:hypothetical protein